MDNVNLTELKDAYLKLQKQKESRRMASKRYQNSARGKASQARANKKYYEKRKLMQKIITKLDRKNV